MHLVGTCTSTRRRATGRKSPFQHHATESTDHASEVPSAGSELLCVPCCAGAPKVARMPPFARTSVEVIGLVNLSRHLLRPLNNFRWGRRAEAWPSVREHDVIPHTCQGASHMRAPTDCWFPGLWRGVKDLVSRPRRGKSASTIKDLVNNVGFTEVTSAASLRFAATAP